MQHSILREKCVFEGSLKYFFYFLSTIVLLYTVSQKKSDEKSIMKFDYVATILFNAATNYTCLGGPRLATCPRKQVFNKETGHCGDPGEVPGW